MKTCSELLEPVSRATFSSLSPIMSRRNNPRTRETLPFAASFCARWPQNVVTGGTGEAAGIHRGQAGAPPNLREQCPSDTSIEQPM
jgi:hypothetical protein